MQNYAALIYAALMWSLAPVYLWDKKLTFDSLNMGHFESYHNDLHGIRNILGLENWLKMSKLF